MEEILKFLDDVLHNNNRPWFQEHKKQYQQAQANFNAWPNKSSLVCKNSTTIAKA